MRRKTSKFYSQVKHLLRDRAMCTPLSKITTNRTLSRCPQFLKAGENLSPVQKSRPSPFCETISIQGNEHMIVALNTKRQVI